MLESKADIRLMSGMGGKRTLTKPLSALQNGWSYAGVLPIKDFPGAPATRDYE